MSHIYTQIHIQIVFSVEGRQKLIRESFREELQKYITGIVQKRNQKLLAIYCMPDHTHILVGLHTDVALDALVSAIKESSREFLNRKRWIPGRFGWQEGYGAFSYGHSQLDRIVRYIRNQPRHHVRRTFREEYLEMLRKFEIIHDERALFGDSNSD